jgi:hypothetical protein
MPARLVALDGTADIPLTGLLTVVGRHRGCNTYIDSSRISRHHCCLALCTDAVLVRDLGSTNGLRINGEPIEEGLLHHGDELTIAHLRYRLVLHPPAEATTSPASPDTDNTRGAPDAPGRDSARDALETLPEAMRLDFAPDDESSTRWPPDPAI